MSNEQPLYSNELPKKTQQKPKKQNQKNQQKFGIFIFILKEVL